jgi:hypothetical protein
MKTDDLVDLLSRNIEAVDWRALPRKLLLFAGLGALAALIALMLVLGPRAEITNGRAWMFVAAKLIFAGAVLAVALSYLVRIARPGGERRVSVAPIVVPFIVALIAAGLSFALAPEPERRAMFLGEHWRLCLVCIPLNAIWPFAAIVLAMRQFAAPTNLSRAGALAGLAAGAISAVVYALHCTDDSLPFIALWYGLAIAGCALVGALLGHRLLRW